MPVRVTVTMSQELLEALDAVADRHGDSRSAVVELLLREAPQVRDAVRRARGDPDDPPRDGARQETVGSHVRRVYG